MSRKQQRGAATPSMMDDEPSTASSVAVAQQQQPNNQFSEFMRVNYPDIYSIFESTFKRRDVTNGNWKTMNIMIEAIAETIHNQKQPMSATSFYGAILRTLSGEHTDAKKVAALLHLLSIVCEQYVELDFYNVIIPQCQTLCFSIEL